MRAYISENWTTVGEAPVGLLRTERGTIICKTEYRKDGDCECYIAESGEYFSNGGEPNKARCQPLIVK